MSSNKSFKKLIITVIITSFIIGSLTGGIVSAIVSSTTSDLFTEWFKVNILHTQSPADVFKKTIKVEEESATIEVVKKVQPSVVSIIVTKDLSKIYSPTWPFEKFFFEFPGFKFEFPEIPQPQGKKEVGGGTGFVISSDGLILTNRHVVLDEEAEYIVLTNDGEKYEAKVLARDLILDLAMVKVETKDLKPVELGDSDNLQIGQTVIAIGNALGEFRNTVTKGVISGIGRTITASGSSGESEVIEEAIQTDAAINPGNSGGPLLNLTGQVIGVNTAISREGQLIGFAIPINEAKRVIESVKKFGKIIRPFLGVRYILLNKEIAKANHLEVESGALIVRGEKPTDLAVVPGSPADKAGLKENDIILEVNGKKISESCSLARILASYTPGDLVKLKILQKGEEKIVEVKLGEFKE